MRVVIYGVGAVGASLAFFARWFQANEVHLVGRKEVVEPMEREGILYAPHSGGPPTLAKGFRAWWGPHALEKLARSCGAPDVVAFCVKAYDLETAAREASPALTKYRPWVLLAMNGLGLAELVKPFAPGCRIVEVSVQHPAALEGNLVRNTGANDHFSLPADAAVREMVSRCFDPAHLKFVENFEEVKWLKVAANSAVNAVTALAAARVGHALANPSLRALVVEAVLEVERVARAAGVAFSVDPVEWLLEFAGRDPRHVTSTLQDLLKGKRTEAEFFNGAVSRAGGRLGVPTPVNEALSVLVRVVERAALGRGFDYSLK
ncbi:MAG: hypothetical protein Kow0069_05150 [Promethearchaeota archaeon]